MAGQKRLTDAYTPAADPEMTAVFTDSDKNQTTVTMVSYALNISFTVILFTRNTLSPTTAGW